MELKFSILSHIFPPTWSGQSIVLYRLLQGVSTDEYSLITSRKQCGNATHALSAQLYQLDRPLKGWEMLAILAGRVAAWQMEKRARLIEQILKDNNIQLLVACSGDLLDIPAGALAARRAGVAFVPYFFDDYLYQWSGWRRRIAQAWEPIALAGAAGAIVPNEFLAEEYRRRYDMASQLVRNPVLPYAGIAGPPRGSKAEGRKRIVYTGSIYHAHYDAFRNLLRALEAAPELAELHLYTAQTPTELAQHGFTGPHVKICGHVSQDESRQVQEAADLLFLPLAFSTTIPEVLRTSAPGKLGEYLASGTPILVHAPADSYLSWFFRKYRCGEVVDAPDVLFLTKTVRRLFAGGADVERMVAQAREVAATEFDADRQSEIFYRYLQTLIRRIS